MEALIYTTDSVVFRNELWIGPGVRGLSPDVCCRRLVLPTSLITLLRGCLQGPTTNWGSNTCMTPSPLDGHKRTLIPDERLAAYPDSSRFIGSISHWGKVRVLDASVSLIGTSRVILDESVRQKSSQTTRSQGSLLGGMGGLVQGVGLRVWCLGFRV